MSFDKQNIHNRMLKSFHGNKEKDISLSKVKEFLNYKIIATKISLKARGLTLSYIILPADLNSENNV